MEYNFSQNELRVLGCLLEKQVTTPDHYPLTLNSLTSACNQKSSREPVLNLSEAEVQGAVDLLVSKRIVTLQTLGSRVNKYDHRFCNQEFGGLSLSAAQVAVLCVLFLRGPQTAGELRTRTQRLYQFSDVQEVEQCLTELQQHQDMAMVKVLPKQAGKRDCRYVQLFSDDTSIDNDTEASDVTPVDRHTSELMQASGLSERVAELELQVSLLQQQLAELTAKFDDH
ncbi:YceH family protein [Motilimonas pumila]|uniref:DUF480 domain-containing protein n=1 Tax=Motilimonas pumila TaxID=2303987 RepID=A0A418YAC0_9GAMM|nr:YceH family protein [Motilimonas pumila]RJG39487.1 DUF480 domain-containing protein [Motilimonas pumila]